MHRVELSISKVPFPLSTSQQWCCFYQEPSHSSSPSKHPGHPFFDYWKISLIPYTWGIASRRGVQLLIEFNCSFNYSLKPWCLWAFFLPDFWNNVLWFTAFWFLLFKFLCKLFIELLIEITFCGNVWSLLYLRQAFITSHIHTEDFYPSNHVLSISLSATFGLKIPTPLGSNCHDHHWPIPNSYKDAPGRTILLKEH